MTRHPHHTPRRLAFEVAVVAVLILGSLLAGPAWYRRCRAEGGTKRACGGAIGERFGK